MARLGALLGISGTVPSQTIPTDPLGNSGTTGVRPAGNVYSYQNATGSGNAAASTATVLATYTLPASAFDTTTRGLMLTAFGKLASNGNNKTIQFYVGSDAQTVGNAIVTTATTSIASSGVSTANNQGWFGEAILIKTGSNTQLGMNLGFAIATTHLGTALPVALALTDSASIVISVTGTSGSSTASDVLLQFLSVDFYN